MISKQSFDHLVNYVNVITISIKNICFFDISIDAINDCVDVINVVFKNENFEIHFEWLINNMNNNVDSIDNKNVTKNINIVIIVFDVKRNIIDTNIVIDIIIANSFDVIIANSFANLINFF